MANFDNVTLGPVIVDVNGQTLGYCKDSSWSVNPSFLELYDLMPKVFVGKQLTDFMSELSVKALELTPQNQIFAMGLNEDILTNVAGSTNSDYWKSVSIYSLDTAYATSAYVEPSTLNGKVYICSVAGTSSATTVPTWPTTIGSTVEDNGITWTCAAYGGEEIAVAGYVDTGETSTNLFKIDLTGYNLQSTAYCRVYNSAYTALFTAESDYFVDLARGILFVHPSGNIATTDTCGILYQYSEINQQRLDYNTSTFDLENQDVAVVHQNTSTGKKIRVDMFDAIAKGAEFETGSNDWNGLNLSIEAIDNTNRASNRLGRIQIES